MDEFGQPGDMVSQLFGIEKSTKAVEYDLGIGGLGDLEEFTGTIQYGDFAQQYKTSYTHREWCKGVKIERKLVDDDQYSIINKRPQQLALVARRSREKHGASVFNNAFNTSIFAGGDTLSLCNAAHTAVGTSTTQANRGTTSLSATALEAARLAMAGFKDETDNLVDVVPDTLLIPINLEELAWQITKSEKVLGSNFNDPNFSRGKYKVVVWPRLSDSNNWFLIDSRYMKMFLKWFDRIPVEFNKDKDFDTYVAKWSVYTRYSYGFSDWKWIYGAEVS
jgi:phage major head subunit gpT-like protein